MTLATLAAPTAVAAASPDVAAPDRTDAEQSVEEPTTDPGPFLGPQYRYDEMGIFERIPYDLVAIPAGVAAWRAEQWATFGGVMAPTFALMAPTDPSPDARIDGWIEQNFDSWFPDIWQMQYQGPFWALLAVGGVGTWGIAARNDHERLAESMSLMAESLATTQVYHLSLKLLTGREGPRDARGRGVFHGPTLEYFPDGTPSGHFATLYTLFGAAQTYWQFPLAWDITGHVLLGALASTHVITHRHFISETFVGSAMGYAIGQWVVRHRSTRYEYRGGESIRVTLVPRPRGLALSFRFTVD